MKITLYRDDSTGQVVFENVKTFFWTANNTVLVISQYTDETKTAHRYIHWPRERFCWFKDERAALEAGRGINRLQREYRDDRAQHAL